jgi:hypothetical protein
MSTDRSRYFGFGRAVLFALGLGVASLGLAGCPQEDEGLEGVKEQLEQTGEKAKEKTEEATE